MRILDNGIYRDMTEEEVQAYAAETTSEMLIEEYKRKLSDTDYKAIKYAEGVMSEEEYAEVKALRQGWRDEINRLEAEVET